MAEQHAIVLGADPMDLDPASSSSPLAGVASVLLVADDDEWLTVMRGALAGENFQVATDPCGDIAFDDERTRFVDAAVIDLGLRHRSGVAVCAALRARSGAPIVATARVADEATVLSAFSAGADQFAPLGVSSRQFVARVRSLLRRYPPNRATAPDLAAGPILLDHTQRTANLQGVAVTLSAQEFDVLSLLMARPGRVVNRADLLAGASSPARSDRALDFVIRRLRQKLEEVDTQRRITAIRGVGFRLEVGESTPERGR